MPELAVSEIMESLNENQRNYVEAVVYNLKSFTQDELGKELGISDRTIRDYNQDENVQKAIKLLIDEKLKNLRPKAYKALEYGLNQRQRWAVELFFKLNGELVERKQISGAEGGPIPIVVHVEDVDLIKGLSSEDK